MFLLPFQDPDPVCWQQHVGIGKSDVFSVVGGDSVLSLLVLLDTSVFHQCGDFSIDGYLFKKCPPSSRPLLSMRTPTGKGSHGFPHWSLFSGPLFTG